MALSKQAKDEIFSEVSVLLENSKLTVVANYRGATVKNLQELRKQAQETGTKVKVVKNNLVIKALSANDRFKNADTSQLNEMLLYAFNSQDEAAPAQILAKFSKKTGKLQFVGAITDKGVFIGPDEVKALSQLPGKTEMIASLIATLNAPLNEVLNGLSGELSSIISSLETKAA